MTTAEFVRKHVGLGTLEDVASAVVDNVDEEEVLWDIAQEYLAHHDELEAELEDLKYEWG